MMRSVRVVPRQHLPTNLPVAGGIVWYLFLRHLGAPGWVFGAFFAVYAIVFIALLVRVYQEKDHAPKWSGDAG